MIVIGVDIGGGSIKGASITDKGKILDEFTIPMDRFKEPEITFGILADTINEFIKSHKYDEEIVGVGLGVPGLIDKEKGTVSSSPNMPKWLNFNIVEFLSSKISLPIKIVNDASAAALGEAKFGSGRNHKYLIMLTLGTGVGGGIVFDGKLIDGNESCGAQLGHSVLVLNGRKCGCGRKGCLEVYASATALVKLGTREARKNPNGTIARIAKENGSMNAKVIFDAEKEKDKIAGKIVDDYIMYLSEGILNICNMFRPDIVVLSGGVANQGQSLISRIEKYVKDRDYGYKNSPSVEIKTAELGYNAGKIGAASLFF